MTVEERIKQYEMQLRELREQQAQIEVAVRRTEGAILALREVMQEQDEATEAERVTTGA